MTRAEGIRLLATEAMYLLSLPRREAILEEWWGHAGDLIDLPADLRREASSADGPRDAADPRYNPLLLHALAAEWLTVSNAYLGERLRAAGHENTIDDAEPRLLACPCCFYQTLTRRGHYDICPVCFWEDDGSDTPALYSSPNHLTLAEARRNFALLGASSPQHVGDVDAAGPRKYHLQNTAEI